MDQVSGVLLAIVVTLLTASIIGLVTGILAWIRSPGLPCHERTAESILRGGAAFAAAALLVLALFAAAGVLH